MKICSILGFALIVSFLSILTVGSVYAANYIQFHGEVLSDKSYFRHGDTIKFRGWSNAYQDSGGVTQTPAALFGVNIIGPDDKTIFKENFVGNEKGEIHFSLPITDDFKVGKYFIKINISKEGYDTYYNDQGWFWVVGTADDIITEKGYDFKIWTRQPEIPFGQNLIIYGNICPQLPDDIASEDFIDPETNILVYKNTVLVNILFTKPNGIITSTPELAEVINCKETEVGNEIPVFDMSGNWTAYVVAKWIDKETIYQIRSQPINIVVKQTFWHSDDITPINLNHDGWNNMAPLDWSHDGNQILFKHWGGQYGQSLALMNHDGKNVRELKIPLHDADNELSIYSALFSSDDEKVYFLTNNNLYLYYLENDTISQLTKDKMISFFDLTNNDDIFYFEESVNPVTTQHDYRVIHSDSKAENGIEVLHGQDFYAFDVSPDAKKLLYKKTLDVGYGWADRVLSVYDFESKKYYQVPKIEDADCGSPPIWTPNSKLIIYHVAGCGRGWPGGILGITDMDGNYELLIPSTDQNNPEHFITSPDGKFLLYSYSSYDISHTADFYKMRLAQPVPEFPMIGLTLVASMVTILVITRTKWV